MAAVHEETIKKMMTAARDAREKAYAPYSGFKVGAAVLCDSGEVYTGCNVESASYGLSVCAERVAIQKAVSEGERHIRAIAIVTEGFDIAPPCGACVQVMAEFSTSEEPAVIVSGTPNGRYEIHNLNDYLPQPFRLEQNKHT